MSARFKGFQATHFSMASAGKLANRDPDSDGRIAGPSDDPDGSIRMDTSVLRSMNPVPDCDVSFEAA